MNSFVVKEEKSHKDSVEDITNKEQLKELIARNNVIVLNFWAPWSEGCLQMNEIFEQLSKSDECKMILFGKIEAEAVPEISMQYEIVAVPTFIFLKQGEIFDRLDGVYPPELAKKIKQCSYGVLPFVGKISMSSAASTTSTSTSNGSSSVDGEFRKEKEETKDELNARLKRLINASACMVFMKGSATEPRCGFSKQLVALLNQANANYQTFDILSDESVRAGLKEYSQWPTYPQVYINGELVGGLDIVRELLETNELQKTLPTKNDNNVERLEQRLKTLINKAPVMVFMKGDPDAPRCGFSRTLMEILKKTGVEFQTFDILEDETVRQGLKTYSNWPTYPQVYVKGELIGGLDIVKELDASGDLKNTLTV